MFDSTHVRLSALAKKISKEVDQQGIGNSIVGMRQARNGALLIEVNGDMTVIESIKAEVAKVVDDNKNV